MRKIISLFQRNYDGDRRVRDEIVPGAEWVIAGEGRATRKWDGTAVLVRGGRLYKRYDAKHGKTPPPDFEPAQDADPVTGHWPGWIPVGDEPASQWIREAFGRYTAPPDGTYEAIGPKIGGNAEHVPVHELRPHGQESADNTVRTFDAIRDYLAAAGIEGIVWHHPDGRMVKIKARDFGIAWPQP